jgi:hypothetical protein
MARQALGRGLVAAGGTMLALGGATIAVSTVSMAVARVVINERKVGARRAAGPAVLRTCMLSGRGHACS